MEPHNINQMYFLRLLKVYRCYCFCKFTSSDFDHNNIMRGSIHQRNSLPTQRQDIQRKGKDEHTK